MLIILEGKSSRENPSGLIRDLIKIGKNLDKVIIPIIIGEAELPPELGNVHALKLDSKMSNFKEISKLFFQKLFDDETINYDYLTGIDVVLGNKYNYISKDYSLIEKKFRAIEALLGINLVSSHKIIFKNIKKILSSPRKISIVIISISLFLFSISLWEVSGAYYSLSFDQVSLIVLGLACLNLLREKTGT